MKFITWWQHFFGLRSDVETENDYRANYDGDDNDDDDDNGGDGFQNGKSDGDVIFNEMTTLRRDNIKERGDIMEEKQGPTP